MNLEKEKSGLTTIQYFGLGLIPLAVLIYWFVPSSAKEFEGGSLINYFLVVMYFVVSFFDKQEGVSIFKQWRPRINWHILLVLLLISCYTLNKSMHLFAQEPVWLQVLFLPVIVGFIAIAFEGRMPVWMARAASFFTGIGFLIFAYYTVVLLPTMPIGFIALFALGISVHLLAPLLLLMVGTLGLLWRRGENALPQWVLYGALFGLVGVFIFIYRYVSFGDRLQEAQPEMVLNETTHLPEWVGYAQKADSKFWTERMVGLGLMYERYFDDGWGFGLDSRQYDYPVKHDPLVITASLFSDDLGLSHRDQVHILNAATNLRDYSYEKLWSGKHLRISKKLTDARIYPNYRLAYVEQSYWVNNDSERNWSTEEALFTFHLPEGAVASSLSLWIDGKEETSRLTTRQKADTAYRTIVGVERRDPVVLHWQEGNRLTATIFPCTIKEPRRVKIGFTVPLQLSDGRLHLHAMQVMGPTSDGAEEIVHLKFFSEAKGVRLPKSFEKKKTMQYLYDGKELDDWSCSFTAVPLANEPFVFNGTRYWAEELDGGEGFSPAVVYVDVNAAWTRHELETVVLAAGDRPVFADDNGWVEVTIDAVDEVYESLSKRPFSLFPVQEVDRRSEALLVTKGQKVAPLPSELKGSKFYKEMVEAMTSDGAALPTVVLGNGLSDYVASLHQYKLLAVQSLSADRLNQSIDHWYKHYPQEDAAVLLPNSGMSIRSAMADSVAMSADAPSHLLRLYNYHRIIQQAGHLFLQEKAGIPQEVYRLCEEGFVVTPVSSLIVLESKKDYERFGIDENENSVKNANLSSSGAVPEPGEWALIILVAVVALFMYFKMR